MRKKVLKIYGYAIGVGLLYWLWGALTGLYLPCFYYSTTGFYCPGCGISRMFLSLFRLEFSEAFAHNPVCFVLVILWSMVSILMMTEKVKFVRSKRFLYTGLYVSIGALLIFCFIRNIP